VVDHGAEASLPVDVRVMVRPERVRVVTAGTVGENTLPATVQNVVYVGSVTQVQLHLADGTELQALLANDGDGRLPVGTDRVAVVLAPDALRVVGIGDPAPLDEDAQA
jgi:hypothetical protein